jgi:rhomboid family GlyGly-CTERM serine protease
MTPLIVKHALPALLLIIVMSLLQMFATTLTPALEYNRSLIIQGEVWRLFTAYWIHTNHWHFLMNTMAFGIILLLHGMYSSVQRFAFNLIVGSSLISIMLLLAFPEQQQFVGLSGWLHAILIWGACIDIQRHLSSGWLILLGVVGKVIWEQMHGASANLAVLIDANVAIDTHLLGVISGFVLYLTTLVYQKLCSTTPRPKPILQEARRSD